jgi:lipopolysaccharide transport system ATP-binding protein
MVSINISNASVRFPIFNSPSRSFTNSLVSAATGGRLTADKGGHIEVQALTNINLDIKSGDRLGIVGKNGSGKSTLLRLISGIYEPMAGTITRSGSISSLIDIGLGINPENTGRENIYLRGKLMGLTKFQISQKIDEIVDFSELGNFIDLPVRTYSSGMLLRLAFSLATSVEANILIMDEWLSVGDGTFAERAKLRLQNLVEQAEILIIASHSQNLIETTSNKLLWLDQGKVQELGDPKEVSAKYFG